MASTWIWRGSYDRLERIAYTGKELHTSGERNGQPLNAQPWSAVKPGDAVLAWSDTRELDRSRFPGVWVLNGNGYIVAKQTDEEKQRIWRRAGLCGGAPLTSERLYLVSIVHLEPVEMVRIDAAGKVLPGRRLVKEAGNKGEGQRKVVLRDLGLGEAEQRNVEFGDAGLRDAGLNDAELRNEGLGDVKSRDAELRDEGSRNTGFNDAKLRYEGLRDAKSRDAGLNDAELKIEGLRDAKSKNAELRDAGFRNAGLRNVESRNAELRNAGLREAGLRNARLRDVESRDGESRNVESKDAGLKQIGAWPEDPALRRVARTAVAALYALGLDIGEAEIALGGDGRTVVRAAWPKLRDTRLEAVVLRRFAAWHAAARAEEGDRRLRIGADPEFVLVTPSGKIASASRFLGAGVGGAAGADALLVGRRLLYPVAELRPEPAEDPAALAANVRRLLLRAADRISDPSLRWAAGAMPVPGLALGGHIHLSGAPLTSRLLRLLDSYAAFPLALVEDPAGRARRPRYGMLGDFRLQPHGGFEYRTLPSWLVSPAAAKASFALALLCVREEQNLDYIPALEERYVEAYYAGDRAVLAGCLDALAASLAATNSYSELAPYIEPLLDAAKRGKTWDERSDIRVKWRLPH